MSPSGGDWLSIYRAVFDHPKAKRLAKRLGMAVPAAVGHLICLWTWCMTIAPDGDLSRFDPEDIEAAAGWGGEDGLFVVAATECRWLDDTGSGLVIHDWADWAGTLVTRRANERKRSADRRSTAGRTAVDQRSAGQTAITERTERTERTEKTEELCRPEDQPDVLCDELVTTSNNGDGSPQLAEAFENWWSEYGRVGDKARAFDLYRWWRTTGRTPADDLLTAAVCYRDHCAATACLMKHGTTFLAKPAKGKSPVWPEWAAGEEHGAMDVGAASHLNDVLVAGARAFGLTTGGDNGNGPHALGHDGSRAFEQGRAAGAAGGRANARRSLSPGKLED